MTINEIKDVISNNYTPMNQYEFMNKWIDESRDTHDEYSLGTLRNQLHGLYASAFVPVSPDGFEGGIVEQLYISYTEDSENLFQGVYQLNENAELPLRFFNLIEIDWNVE